MGRLSKAGKTGVKYALRLSFGLASSVGLLYALDLQPQYDNDLLSTLANLADAGSIIIPYGHYLSVASFAGGHMGAQFTLDIYRNLIRNLRPGRFVAEIFNSAINVTTCTVGVLTGAAFGAKVTTYFQNLDASFLNMDSLMIASGIGKSPFTKEGSYGFAHVTFDSAVSGVSLLANQCWATITHGAISGLNSLRFVGLYSGKGNFIDNPDAAAGALTLSCAAMGCVLVWEGCRPVSRLPIQTVNWVQNKGFVYDTQAELDRQDELKPAV